MFRSSVICLAAVLVACAHGHRHGPVVPEPWFRNIRVMTAFEAEDCSVGTIVETEVNGAKMDPPVPAADFRRLRRIAFDDFEGKVVGAGGNAVRNLIFRESCSPGPPRFLLYSVWLSGEGVRCK
jgi:hypothetical protein